MAIKDAVSTILNRNAFYRDGYRMLLRISLVQLAVIIVLAVSLVGLAITVHTRQIYFATTSDGRIIPIVPLNEPLRSQAEVVTWAASTAQDVMRFDYVDFRGRLQQASNNFTAVGWETFNKAIKDASLIEAVQARKLVVSLQINAAPEIVSAGVNNNDNVYSWDLRMPILIKYDGADAPTPVAAMLYLRIVRVPTLQNPDGISIAQWVVRAGASR